MAGVKKVLISIIRFIPSRLWVLVSIGLVAGAISMAGCDDYTPSNAEVTAVSGTLARNIEMSIYGNGEVRNVRFELNEYPGCTFVISGDALHASRYLMMNDYLQVGDSLFLQVSGDDLRARERNKADGYGTGVAVYGARSSNQIYLTMGSY